MRNPTGIVQTFLEHEYTYALTIVQFSHGTRNHLKAISIGTYAIQRSGLPWVIRVRVGDVQF